MNRPPVPGKRAPSERLSVDERYRLLVEAVTDYAIFMLDEDGYVSSWNPGARRNIGYEPQEIIGEHFSCFYTEDDRASGLPAATLETARREGRFEGDGWRVRKDGTRFWANVAIDPIRDAAGAVIGFAKITRDLTERKLAADRLGRSEQQFRLLVQSVVDYAIYMLDPEGRVTNWNAGAERIKGYKASEIVGEHFSKFYEEADRAKGEPARGLEIARRTGKFEKEGWRVRKDGSRFWASVVIDAVRDDSGQLIGFAKITRDITERREAQLAIERARESLFQSQKMEALGQLTGGIAHDFNNLLMAVMSGLELLQKRLPDDPRTKLLLDNTFDGARRGVALTQRMLTFARRQQLKLATVDVGTLVSGIGELLERSIGPSIVIERNLPLRLPQVKVDPNQLETSLLNLVVNARDAMPHGGIIRISASAERVRSDAESQLAPGNYICLSVEDTGEGMDPDTLARAAEPFFTTKGVGKGTGLGLSMVHGMAEQLGGCLRLQSTPGKGTRAEIWLPVAEPVAAVTPATLQVHARPGPASRALVFVVVDDDRLVLVNTSAMLEELGHKVIDASSAKQALERIRATPHVDVVITDQAMPHMTGLELAAVLKAERPGLPVVLMTGYAELPPGSDELNLMKLVKPFSFEDLEAAIVQSTAAAGQQKNLKPVQRG